jgi:1-acyl-sn-glycerol-3-phosphate acyltransferase
VVVIDARKKARRAARVAGFGAVTATLLPAYAMRDAMSRPEDRGALRDRWVARWCDALLALFAVKVEAHGVTRAPGARMIVANHRSTIDIAVLLRSFGGRVVSRADLSGWPLIGVAARKVGTVFVDRKDAQSGASAVRAMRTLLERGETVIVFAEGTTFSDDEVRPFHGGAFVAAAGTGAEIVPVGLAYPRGSGAAFVNETFPQHLARMAAADPTRVVLIAGAPIIAAPKVRSTKLRDETHAAVQSLVHEARATVER